MEVCHFSPLAHCNHHHHHHDLSSWHHLSSSLNPSLAIVEPDPWLREAQKPPIFLEQEKARTLLAVSMKHG